MLPNLSGLAIGIKHGPDRPDIAIPNPWLASYRERYIRNCEGGGGGGGGGGNKAETDNLRKQLAAHKTEIQSLEDELLEARSESDALKGDAGADVEALRAELLAERERADALISDAKLLEVRAEEAEETQRELSLELKDVEEERDLLSRGETVLLKELTNREENESRLNDELRQAEESVLRLQAELEDTVDRKEDSEDFLEDLKGNLELERERVQDLRNEKRDVQKMLDDTTRLAKERYDNMVSERDDLTRQLREQTIELRNERAKLKELEELEEEENASTMREAERVREGGRLGRLQSTTLLPLGQKLRPL